MKSDWISVRSPEETIEFIQCVSGHLAIGASKLAQDLNRLVQESKFREVVDFHFDYTQPYSGRDFLIARQIQALVSKQSEWLDLGYDPLAVAFDKFIASEYRCLETNLRLESALPRSGSVSSVLYRAQRKISDILGEVPSLSDLEYSFGPGATTSVAGSIASPRAKLGASLACSEEMLPFVGHFLAEMPLWAWSQTGATDSPWDHVSDSCEEVRWFVGVEAHDGKLDFVPKDAKQKRPIVVEPVLNGVCQRGVGSYIRRRLLSTSDVDLRDQSRNRSLARVGSLDGSLATIDLASASDTVSLALIWDLLPMPWAEFLTKLRTPTVGYKSQRIELSKFSSMGNGFTFELESLLFYSLSVAVSQHLGLDPSKVSIFGDDIIIASEAFPLLQEVLDYCGFEVNTKKSFWSGPFRESCGADWFAGMDIRPFYLKEQISDRSLYTFHNWAVRNGEFTLAALILSFTQAHLRLFGPDGYGDGHLVGSFTLRSNRKLKRSQWEGGFFDTYSLKPKRVKTRYRGDWVYPSYSVYTRSGERSITDPDIVRGSNGYAKMSLYTLATTVFRRDLR